MARSSNKDILKYLFLNWRIFQACTVILFFLEGKLAPEEAIQPLLHGSFKDKNQRSRFRHLLFEFINRRFGQFNLYGNPLSPASKNYVEAIGFIYEVIIKNQYRTNLIKNGDVVIDAGANIGVFSVKVAHDFPNSKVYSFEPTPATFTALKKNTECYPNVSCFNFGLGNKAAEKKLFTWDNFSGANGIDRPTVAEFGKPDRVHNIQITTIDKFAKDLPGVDFIKMDTEGYESNILKGATETIKKWKPIIAMSAYHNPNDKEELPKLVRSICSDYVCELRHDAEEDLICRVAS